MGFVTSCFERKPIALMAPEGEGVLRRVLGAGDLIMLSIGAVIGAGILARSVPRRPASSTRRVTSSGRGAGPAIVFLVHPGGIRVRARRAVVTRKWRR